MSDNEEPAFEPIVIDPAEFPGEIRVMDAASFEQGKEDPSVQPNDTDGGYLITRPRSTRRPRRNWRFKFVEMRDRDADGLERFWDAVMGRSNAFNWTHPQTGEVINVRFGEMKMNLRRIGFGHVNIWESDQIVLNEV